MSARPLIVKLSPNVTSIAHMAKIAAESGADAVSLVNTFMAMSIDGETRRPRLTNVTGGLSGPAIKPIALRMVYETAQAVSIPVIGMGGIVTPEDAVEFFCWPAPLPFRWARPVMRTRAPWSAWPSALSPGARATRWSR